jgi:hypothetical protein
MKYPETKHIIAYLPFNVKMQTITQGSFVPDPPINKLELVTVENISNLINKRYRVISCKLALRPMPYFPTQCWYDEDQNEYMIEWDNEGMELMIRDNNPSHVGQPLNALACHELMQTVFEGHYDLFDLIGQNLAIDINTL